MLGGWGKEKETHTHIETHLSSACSPLKWQQQSSLSQVKGRNQLHLAVE